MAAARSVGEGPEQGYFVALAAAILFSPLILLATGVIHTGSQDREAWLRQATAQCGESGVKSIQADVVICRDGRVVIR